MDKLSDDIQKKIKELCVTNISKQMNKIQVFQIKKLTKQFISKINIVIFNIIFIV